MRISKKEMQDYLINKQGYQENIVYNMDVIELYDLYTMYHEDQQLWNL